MSGKDYVESIRDGLGFVGRMAVKGVSQISKQFKTDDKKDQGPARPTGLYYQKQASPVQLGNIIPRLEYYESVSRNSLTSSFVKRLVRSQADRAFAAGCMSVLIGDYRSAIDRFKDSLSADPQNSDCYFLKGVLHIQLGEYQNAEESFSKCRLIPYGLGEGIRKFLPSLRLSLFLTENIAFSFYPDITGLNLLLAISQRNSGKCALAIQTLEQILSVMPGNPEIKLFLAAFYYEAGWDDKVIDLLKDTIPADNLSALSAELLAQVWLGKKSTTLADAVLNKALESGEIEPYIVSDIRMLLAKVARENMRLSEAAALEGRVKKLTPDYKSLPERLGLVHPQKPIAVASTPPAPMAPVTVEAPPPPSGDTVEVNIEESTEPEVIRQPDYEQTKTTGTEPGQLKIKSQDGTLDMPLPDSLTIGREEGDIILEGDDSASHIHAKIFHDRGQVWIEDLNSTNGTWVNRHRVSGKRTINKGDNILIGNTEFRIE